MRVDKYNEGWGGGSFAEKMKLDEEEKKGKRKCTGGGESVSNEEERR